MKLKRIAALICSLFIGAQVSSGFAKTLVHQHASADLDFLEHLLDTKYAPKPWKETLFGWNLQDATNAARLKLILEENPSTGYCQRVLADYIGALNDYHAGVTFFATSRSYLPYTVKLSNTGRCYVVESFTYNSDISVYDEILEVDGIPIAQVIESLRMGRGSAADYAAAARSLFSRSASVGHAIPLGGVTLKVRRPSGLIRTVRVKWRYTPEHITDLSLISPLIKDTSLNMQRDARSLSLTSDKRKCLFTNEMVPYFWKELREEYKRRATGSYDIGSKKGFLPEYPMVTWRCKEGPYHAYVFSCQDNAGRNYNIGFLRISTYSWTDLQDLNEDHRDCPWLDLEEIIKELEERTDGLIIDQTNNPGGSIFYLYAVLSMLTSTPLETPRHRMILTQDEVHAALHWLELLEGVDTDREAVAALGETMEGYPIDIVAAGYIQSFSEQVLNCWNSGNINLTSPIPLLGFSHIQPHPRVQYSHPICAIINEEDFSCADLFPSILKDNGRALIVGNTTAGAGGFVFSVEFPNRTGIKSCSLTGSLAVRKDGMLIENLGVSPDVYLEITDEDLQSGKYGSYMKKLQDIMINLISATQSEE
ncbi:Protein CT_858 [Chlamydia avium]|uniref:Peptidase S41 family protein n=1 Tax=Chlamydia avium TaxID=1457141 RepID=A0ABN0MRD8_9CHLA|nr:protease-like activity factor CPAF [Chlamydia avium]EPP37577.1 peptidase S41 family protein [Chlamydia psittaci 10_743_SC13]EPP38043.1 peptidase S41 family protein [Chlamydia avium]VVT42978.1 Protein CT_858 [Chlamydia avium]